ncbi:hypothetical protein V8F06_007933 [Rhypophila decipiens]
MNFWSMNPRSTSASQRRLVSFLLTPWARGFLFLGNARPVISASISWCYMVGMGYVLSTGSHTVPHPISGDSGHATHSKDTSASHRTAALAATPTKTPAPREREQDEVQRGEGWQGNKDHLVCRCANSLVSHASQPLLLVLLEVVGVLGPSGLGWR